LQNSDLKGYKKSAILIRKRSQLNLRATTQKAASSSSKPDQSERNKTLEAAEGKMDNISVISYGV
jgi:hypothetical protein